MAWWMQAQRGALMLPEPNLGGYACERRVAGPQRRSRRAAKVATFSPFVSSPRNYSFYEAHL
jgi:hypothetical protein